MGLFSSIKDKVTTTLQGELVSELGTLPIDDEGREISLSIRRHSGKKPHLQVKLAATGGADYFKIPCSRAWADQFEKVAGEMRKQSDA
jgi:hypothetical protein